MTSNLKDFFIEMDIFLRVGRIDKTNKTYM